ncbi:MAG: GNAT family N-acetyltransferase [Woeseiaceae bacterium]|nr:GNAT family N-acetyltransferase [Woeseiaceae bacterium]
MTGFRPYSPADRDACLALFDANCPAFFAPNERADYAAFLDGAPDGYEVCEQAGRVVGAFGLVIDARDGAGLNWILLDPAAQGMGLGSSIMTRVISRARASEVDRIRIAASHKSAPFFEKFGAVATARMEDGWGPGMTRVDMELLL